MLWSTRPSFAFVDPGRLIDGDLELVEPHARWVDALLASCAHPDTRRIEPEVARTTREQIVGFLESCPRGRQAANPGIGIVPAYHFWMCWSRPGGAPAEVVGSVALRVGETEDLTLYLGHVGYNVLPPARGHGFAGRATRLVLPIARAHGMAHLWITTNPDNIASRRTIERLGATFVDVLPLPPEHTLRARGETAKCRYRLDL